MRKSLFIVVDGIDGSGKSEIVKMLHNYLFSKNKKFRILTTREPTNGTYGRQIRSMLEQENDPLSGGSKLIDLFIKDRQEHLRNTIEPFLNNQNDDEMNIVLCDRYYYSTIAFQGAQGFNLDELIEKSIQFKKPDVAFILDAAPSLALKRIEHRKKEKFEQLEFMSKIRNIFLDLPELMEENIIIVDSNRPLREVFEKIKKEVDRLI